MTHGTIDANSRGGAVAVERSGDAVAPVDKVAAQLAALETMTNEQLRSEWLRSYSVEPPIRLSRSVLLLGVGWKIQERAYGGLSAATKRRLETLAKTLHEGREIKASPKAKLREGTRLIREWHGETHAVTVTGRGFEWRGTMWRSLSVIAREITGQRWSGPRFFGLPRARGGRLSDGRKADDE